MKRADKPNWACHKCGAKPDGLGSGGYPLDLCKHCDCTVWDRYDKAGNQVGSVVLIPEIKEN